MAHVDTLPSHVHHIRCWFHLHKQTHVVTAISWLFGILLVTKQQQHKWSPLYCWCQLQRCCLSWWQPLCFHQGSLSAEADNYAITDNTNTKLLCCNYERRDCCLYSYMTTPPQQQCQLCMLASTSSPLLPRARHTTCTAVKDATPCQTQALALLPAFLGS